MRFPPIPCAHCGTNFMRRSIDPEAPKLCNNCELKVSNTKPKEKTNMDNVKILIECTRKVQIEVEEYCVNMGLTISDYFVDLHNVFQSVGVETDSLESYVEKPLEKVVNDLEDLTKKSKAKKK